MPINCFWVGVQNPLAEVVLLKRIRIASKLEHKHVKTKTVDELIFLWWIPTGFAFADSDIQRWKHFPQCN